MRVSEVMTADVTACSPTDDTAVATRIMWERDCGCVPVVDGESKVIGMITDRDICMAAYTRDARPHELRVDSVMTAGPKTCLGSERIQDVEQRMASAQVRRLPVVDAEGRLRGIVSINDIARARAHVRGHHEDVTTTLAAIGQPRQAVVHA